MRSWLTSRNPRPNDRRRIWRRGEVTAISPPSTRLPDIAGWSGYRFNSGHPEISKRRGKEAIWARWKSRLETEFFGEGELMVRKPRAPAMSKEAMRQESERLVREAMARNVTITQGKTRLDVKCSQCGAPNRVSAEVDHGRVEYACKECGHKQKTL